MFERYPLLLFVAFDVWLDRVVIANPCTTAALAVVSCKQLYSNTRRNGIDVQMLLNCCALLESIIAIDRTVESFSHLRDMRRELEALYHRNPDDDLEDDVTFLDEGDSCY